MVTALLAAVVLAQDPIPGDEWLPHSPNTLFSFGSTPASQTVPFGTIINVTATMADMDTFRHATTNQTQMFGSSGQTVLAEIDSGEVLSTSLNVNGATGSYAWTYVIEAVGNNEEEGDTYIDVFTFTDANTLAALKDVYTNPCKSEHLVRITYP